MRTQWRLLLQRCKRIPQIHVKVQSSTTHSLSHLRALSSVIPNSHGPNTLFLNLTLFRDPNILRLPSSPTSSFELAIEQNKISDHRAIRSALIELYTDPKKTTEDVMLELTSKDNLASDESVSELFISRGSDPDSARKFFDWVMSEGIDDLHSDLCNRMLEMLWANGLVKEFCQLVEVMKRKGYEVNIRASVRAMPMFEEEGMKGDVQKLKDSFALGSVDGSVEKVSSRVCKVITQGPWGDDVEKKLLEMDVEYSSDLAVAVLQHIGTEPNKALTYFRWIEESGLFKHDEKTYNAMARVLAREDYLDKFWKLIDEMRVAGYDMEKATYVRVLHQFIRKKMVTDAVNLYEFAMGGNITPSVENCPFLLRKIVESDELDMNLFSKVLKIYKERGNTLTGDTLYPVLTSLKSVGRFGECNKILKAMGESGYVPGYYLEAEIAFQLCKEGKTEEVSEFLDFMEASGSTSNHSTWVSLIEGHCLAGNLDKASELFKGIGWELALVSNGVLETIVDAYCSKGCALDAYKFVSAVVIEEKMRPSYRIYELLINKLLDQGLVKEAINPLCLMNSLGRKPLLDPFVDYLSRTGTTDDTVTFLRAMAVKRFPSAVYTRVFAAYFEAGRHTEAQEVLKKCSRSVRNDPDVLNLFHSMKSAKAAAVSTPVAE